MTKKLLIAYSLVSSLFFYSCVSSKKYNAANDKLQQATTRVQQLEATNSELTAKQNELLAQADKMVASNKAVNQEYSQLKSDCETSKQKLADYEAAANKEEMALREMEEKLGKAVADFTGKGVEVYAKDRMIYVNMDDNLLYKSGSASLAKEGKAALAAVAAALNEYPNLKVVVVGNTDDKKFKNSNTDNLSLSTERANGVVRILRDSYNVDPVRLTAAGQGKYNPVADNATAQGRAKNRRTEIILRPDFMKLWQSVQQ